MYCSYNNKRSVCVSIMRINEFISVRARVLVGLNEKPGSKITRKSLELVDNYGREVLRGTKFKISDKPNDFITGYDMLDEAWLIIELNKVKE